MKMSLARALREKNRLADEIDRLWKIFQSENSCLETHKRTADVKKTYQTINSCTAKLVELKAKIGNANSAEHLRKMHLLDETKNRLAKLSDADGSEDPKIGYNDQKTERTAVFNDAMLIMMRHQNEANRLQDELDAFNASTQIDCDSPLK